MIDATRYPFAYRCPFCNEQIFFFKEKPESAQRIMAQNIWYKNEKQPKAGDPIKCPKCQGTFSTLYTRYVEPTQI